MYYINYFTEVRVEDTGTQNRKQRGTRGTEKTVMWAYPKQRESEEIAMLATSRRQLLPIQNRESERGGTVIEVTDLLLWGIAEMTWIDGDLYALIVESRALKGICNF